MKGAHTQEHTTLAQLRINLRELTAYMENLPQGADYYLAEQERQRLVSQIALAGTGHEPVF